MIKCNIKINHYQIWLELVAAASMYTKKEQLRNCRQEWWCPLGWAFLRNLDEFLCGVGRIFTQGNSFHAWWEMCPYEVRFLMHGLAISPQSSASELSRQNFLEKKMAGALGLEPLWMVLVVKFYNDLGKKWERLPSGFLWLPDNFLKTLQILWALSNKK